MLRSTKRIERHTELLKLIILHPNETVKAMQENGMNGSPLNERNQRKLTRLIKEKVNGSDH